MKHRLFLLICSCILFQHANAQVVFQVNAGSRAAWGTYQDLLIKDNGQCTYKVTEVNGAVKESKTFNITQTQLDELLAKADELGFFGLKTKYDGGYADGSGIFIAMNRAGKKHSVDLLNMDKPEINQLIGYLNQLLGSQKIRIYYGQTPK